MEIIKELKIDGGVFDIYFLEDGQYKKIEIQIKRYENAVERDFNIVVNAIWDLLIGDNGNDKMLKIKFKYVNKNSDLDTGKIILTTFKKLKK